MDDTVLSEVVLFAAPWVVLVIGAGLWWLVKRARRGEAEGQPSPRTVHACPAPFPTNVTSNPGASQCVS